MVNRYKDKSSGPWRKRERSALNNLGSVGLSLIYWVLGFLFAASAQAVYLELASYFPSRSGGEVDYLEQAYPRPKYLFPTVLRLSLPFCQLLVAMQSFRRPDFFYNGTDC